MINLKNIEKYHENNRIEAKKALGGLPESIWETYSSFANTMGGVILLGVTEDKDHDLHPIDLPKAEELVDQFWLLVNSKDRANKNILSADDVKIENVDGNRIIVINVPRAERVDRPIFIDGDINTGTYKRNGEGDYKCSKAEINAMLRDASGKTHDRRIIKNMTVEVFDKRSIKAYSRLIGNKVNLVRIGAVSSDKKGILRPTVAGLLMFGKIDEILKEFPNFFLDYQERLNDDLSITYRLNELNIFNFYNKVSKVIDDNIATELKSVAKEFLLSSIIGADYYGVRGFIVIKGKTQINISSPGSYKIDLDYAKVEEVFETRNNNISYMLKTVNKSDDGIYSLRKRIRTVESFNPDRTITTIFLNDNLDVKVDYMLREKVITCLTNANTVNRWELFDKFNDDVDGVVRILSELEDEELLLSRDKDVYYLNNLR